MNLTLNQRGALRFALLEASRRDPLAARVLAPILELIDGRRQGTTIVIECSDQPEEQDRMRFFDERA